MPLVLMHDRYAVRNQPVEPFDPAHLSWAVGGEMSDDEDAVDCTRKRLVAFGQKNVVGGQQITAVRGFGVVYLFGDAVYGRHHFERVADPARRFSALSGRVIEYPP